MSGVVGLLCALVALLAWCCLRMACDIQTLRRDVEGLKGSPPIRDTPPVDGVRSPDAARFPPELSSGER